MPVQRLKALFISCTSCKAGSVVKSRSHKEKVKSYIMGTLRNAFQVRVAQSYAPPRRMINYVKFAPWLVSVVLVTALASGLQWLTPSLRKRSAQNHPTRIVCACSRLAPLSPRPQHAASRWPPLRGCFSRVACPASPHTRKRRPGVPLTGWRWGRGSAFPAFRKVGECQR